MKLISKLSKAVIEGDSELSVVLAKDIVKQHIDIHKAILEGLNEGMRKVSELYAIREYYLPEIIVAADALYAALEVLKPHLELELSHKGTVVIGVVRGDIHDIGKNLTKTFLEASGYRVIDCGRNVQPEIFIQAIEENKADVLALSTLMNPTLESIEKLLSMLIENNIRNKLKIIIGGAATSQQFADKLGVIYCSDASRASYILDKLLSEAYWKEQTQKIDSGKAKPFKYPGMITTPGENTTHFVVADQWGNIVCATQTLGNAFGSRIMPKGTGVWLNNSLAYCTFEPKGNPMDAHAGHHKLSGDCPTLILKNSKPWVAIGTPGGHTIGQTVPQMVMNLIDFHMDIQKAIAAPRISFIEPDILALESDIPVDIQNELKDIGHNIKTGRGLGNAHGLSIEYNSAGEPVQFTGGADPRGSGLAKGL